MPRLLFIFAIVMSASFAFANSTIYPSPAHLPEKLQKEKIWRGIKARDYFDALAPVLGEWVVSTTELNETTVTKYRLQYFDFTKRIFVYEATVQKQGAPAVVSYFTATTEESAYVQIASDPSSCSALGEFQMVEVPAGTFRSCVVTKRDYVTHFFPVPGGVVRLEEFAPNPKLQVLESFTRYPPEIHVN